MVIILTKIKSEIDIFIDKFMQYILIPSIIKYRNYDIINKIYSINLMLIINKITAFK